MRLHLLSLSIFKEKKFGCYKRKWGSLVNHEGQFWSVSKVKYLIAFHIMKGWQISHNVKQGFKIKAYMRWFAEKNNVMKSASLQKYLKCKNFEIINKSTVHY